MTPMVHIMRFTFTVIAIILHLGIFSSTDSLLEAYHPQHHKQPTFPSQQQSKHEHITTIVNSGNVHDTENDTRKLINYDQSFDRRKLLATTFSCACWALINPTLSRCNDAAYAVEGVIRSKGCYQGIGDGCNEFSENNLLIQQLQEKSKLNKDRNEKEALYAYYMKNYPDFFNSIGQVMIMKASDGTFTLVSPQEAQRLKDLGQLSYEIPKTRGGRIIDYTQKPILMLKD